MKSHQSSWICANPRASVSFAAALTRPPRRVGRKSACRWKHCVFPACFCVLSQHVSPGMMLDYSSTSRVLCFSNSFHLQELGTVVLSRKTQPSHGRHGAGLSGLFLRKSWEFRVDSPQSGAEMGRREGLERRGEDRSSRDEVNNEVNNSVGKQVIDGRFRILGHLWCRTFQMAGKGFGIHLERERLLERRKTWQS